MKPQEVKPKGRRLIGWVSVRREDICTACHFDETVAGNGRKSNHAVSRDGGTYVLKVYDEVPRGQAEGADRLARLL